MFNKRTASFQPSLETDPKEVTVSKHLCRVVYVVAVALMCRTAAMADRPVRNDTLVPFYHHIRGGACDPTDNSVGMITASTSPSTPLFNGNRGPTGAPPAPCNMILAPDGHQLTLGEFNAAVGRVLVNCIKTGTHTAIHFSGLVPKGTYTVWLVRVNPAIIGAGSLGATALSANSFVASEAGEGELSRTTPEQDLSIFGHIGACFLDDVVELHVVYHLDQQTHGPVPGPLNTWVVIARFFLP